MATFPEMCTRSMPPTWRAGTPPAAEVARGRPLPAEKTPRAAATLARRNGGARTLSPARAVGDAPHRGTNTRLLGSGVTCARPEQRHLVCLRRAGARSHGDRGGLVRGSLGPRRGNAFYHLRRPRHRVSSMRVRVHGGSASSPARVGAAEPLTASPQASAFPSGSREEGCRVLTAAFTLRARASGRGAGNGGRRGCAHARAQSVGDHRVTPESSRDVACAAKAVGRSRRVRPCHRREAWCPAAS